VTDAQHRVTELDDEGRVVRRWGGLGDEPGAFDFGRPDQSIGMRAAIAVGPDGQVYVSDGENHRVQVFTPDGRFLRTFGSLGSGPGQFTIPFDLAADAQGNVYVIDDGAQRITRFDARGAPTWTADATTDPRLLGHAHTAAFDSAGRLVVAIDDSETIVRLDAATGQVLEVLPNGACASVIDPWDRILSVDCVDGSVRILDATGRLLGHDGALRVRALQMGHDGRAVAIGTDGAVLFLEVTPP
jgi:streptogramin lyase